MPSVWAIRDVEIPPSGARSLAHVSIGGAEGVIEPGGLKVQQLATPGAAVRVLPGAAAITSRYPGGSLQSYAVHETVQQQVSIAATGSSGVRTDLLVVRVRDSEYETTTAPGATFEVIQGVPSTTTADYVATLDYPALALAKITIPASTATITAGMITDLRSLARPRSTRDVRTVSVAHGQAVASSAWVQWPAEAVPVAVPSWANLAVVRYEMTVGHQIGDLNGDIELRLGTQTIASRALNQDLDGGSQRIGLLVAGTATILVSAGEMRNVTMRARRTSGTGRLITLADSQAVVDVQFLETAV